MIRKLLSAIKNRLLQFLPTESFIPQKIIPEMYALAKDIQVLLSSNPGGGRSRNHFYLKYLHQPNIWNFSCLTFKARDGVVKR